MCLRIDEFLRFPARLERPGENHAVKLSIGNDRENGFPHSAMTAFEEGAGVCPQQLMLNLVPVEFNAEFS